MDSRKKRLITIGLILGVLGYALIFPRSLGRELLMSPLWASELDANRAQQTSGDTRYFKLGNFFGYVDGQGRMARALQAWFNVAISDRSYINYSSGADTAVVQNPNGQMTGVIRSNGYPFMRSDRIFFLSVDLTAISEWTAKGDLIWSRTFNTMITGVDAGQERTAVGLEDGHAFVLDRKGNQVAAFDSQGSRLGVVLGIAMGSDDRFLALLGGIDPEKLTLYEWNGKAYREITQFLLKGEYRRSVGIVFLPSSPWLMFEQPEGLELVHPEMKKLVRIGLDGELYGTGERISHGLLSAAAAKDGRVHLAWFLTSGKKVVDVHRRREGPYFFRQLADSVVFGFGRRLYSVRMEEG